ncbi:putative secreted protein [Rhodopirellula maiorica SM1]|uniref:Putative secreted protein n=1 Tax=Rhodopirellula maiorica SM1 TaxID=1265738 RepID=M5RS23_9BACT|nr:hypothetical protein [Rhodopirellula maiorica]EMI22006.1 putative secreted protein [Rhodopirellula maiorica SM1]
MKLAPLCSFLLLTVVAISSPGCSLVPDTRQRESLHNPFPQMKRVAVLPFFNQSNEPTLDTELVSESYYAALQSIPGFEVMPIGVTKAQWLQYSATQGEPTTGADFQRLAKMMDVEAIVVGSVTDFQAYYPPRMAMTVHWYAANEGFHPIPAGYGLPWGTDKEKEIPRRIVREAEFELARSQLETQSPLSGDEPAAVSQRHLHRVSAEMPLDGNQLRPTNVNDDSQIDAMELGATPSLDRHRYAENPVPGDGHDGAGYQGSPMAEEVGLGLFQDQLPESPLPANWPEPTDLIPDPPSPVRPATIVNHDPVLSHTRIYRGDDSYFTNRLADYVETGDDARSGGWQGYLKRSDDFIRFCCHVHISEMLESRGGSDARDLILRWPLSRY